MASPERDPTVAKYAHLAQDYDRRWSFYVTASVDHTVARLAPEAGQRVLDVGCGTGRLLSTLAARSAVLKLYGVDATTEMLDVALQTLPAGVSLVTARAEHLPFGDDLFDWVISTNVFHYLRQPQSALDEWRRVLRPEGSLVMTDWCDDYLTCKVCDRILRVLSRTHVQTYGRRECEHLLRAASFTGVTVERYRISWLWGLMTAQGTKRVA